MAKAKELDINSIVDKYKELKKKGGGSANFLKLDGEETRVRIVPYEMEDGIMGVMHEFSQHVIAKKFYVCLKSSGKPCPICDAADLMWERGEKEVAKQLNPKSRFMFWVLHEGKLKIMEVGMTVAKGIMKFFADEDYQHFTSLENGHDVKITKSGSGLDTEYEVIIVPKSSKVILPEVPKDLATMVKSPLSANELKAVVLSHYAIEDDSTPDVEPEEVEEDGETEAKLKERLKAEAMARISAAKQKVTPTTKKPVRK